MKWIWLFLLTVQVFITQSALSTARKWQATAEQAVKVATEATAAAKAAADTSQRAIATATFANNTSEQAIQDLNACYKALKPAPHIGTPIPHTTPQLQWIDVGGSSSGLVFSQDATKDTTAADPPCQPFQQGMTLMPGACAGITIEVPVK